ncbi:LytR C-terminal domain-containing protein, partial [Ilumatobacter sp.]|uniref:LytR C-terminal domain-containing protein n=1 Tax=Ilumatobacter sp. TaxID=1967498 RepID=UPI003C60F679
VDSTVSETAAIAESTTSAPLEASADTEPEPENESTEPPATSATTALTSPTTTTIPELPVEAREGVRVRVVNGGAAAGGAQFVTEVLEGEGFAPAGPADAVTQVPQTTVFFAPGQEISASTIGRMIAAGGDFIIAGTDDANWNEFGSELDVLVVLGPA